MRETTIDWGEVVDRAPDGVVCTDERGRIVLANRAAERFLGREKGELVDKPVAEVMASEEGEPWPPREGFVAPIRAVGLRKDGARVPLEVSFTNTRPKTGGHELLVIVARDLSVNDRSLAAVELAAERDAFLSMAAHQLRAPIQPILSSLRTIERALSLGTRPPDDTMSRALRQAKRLGRLVDAILNDATAIERGGVLTLHVAPFDLAAFARDVVDDFRLALPEKEIVYRGPSEGVVVVSDRERVYQILISLIDNALKYSARDRAVTVEVSASPARARLCVIDEGIGIPSSEQSRVFGKFYRGSNVPSAASGLGVGLYLARGLALGLHGSLTVSSEVGRGSVFSLVLPRSFPDAGRSRPRSADEHVRSSTS